MEMVSTAPLGLTRAISTSSRGTDFFLPVRTRVSPSRAASSTDQKDEVVQSGILTSEIWWGAAGREKSRKKTRSSWVTAIRLLWATMFALLALSFGNFQRPRGWISGV